MVGQLLTAACTICNEVRWDDDGTFSRLTLMALSSLSHEFYKTNFRIHSAPIGGTLPKWLMGWPACARAGFTKKMKILKIYGFGIFTHLNSDFPVCSVPRHWIFAPSMAWPNHLIRFSICLIFRIRCFLNEMVCLSRNLKRDNDIYFADFISVDNEHVWKHSRHGNTLMPLRRRHTNKFCVTRN